MNRLILLFLFVVISSNSLFAYESEDILKVVIIGKLAKFVTWQDNSPERFVITVLHNSFDDLLDTVYRDKKIHSKDIEIRYIDDIDDLNFTHILYFPQVNHDQLERILEKTSHKSILTISDTRGFAQKGGMIQVYFASQKIRLKINNSVSKKENLKISSSLLRISEIVDGGG